MKAFKLILIGLTVFSGILSLGADTNQTTINDIKSKAISFITPGTYKLESQTDGSQCTDEITVSGADLNITFEALSPATGFKLSGLNWKYKSADVISAQRNYNTDGKEILDSKEAAEYTTDYELTNYQNYISLSQRRGYPNDPKLETEITNIEFKNDSIKISIPQHYKTKDKDMVVHDDCIYKKDPSQTKVTLPKQPNVNVKITAPSKQQPTKAKQLAVK